MAATHKGSMDRLRAWLRHNKILFDTVPAVLLSAMAIILSAQANRIARAQMSLAERQTAIADVQNQPFFRVALMVHWDSVSQKFDEDKLAIINDGAPAYNPHARLAQFLSFRCPGADSDSMIPLHGYFDSSVLTGRRSDTLEQFAGSHNRQAFGILYRSVLARAASSNEPGWIGQRTFLRMDYLDRTSRPQVRFFEIDPGGAVLLDSAVGDRLVARYDSSGSPPGVDLHTATADTVARACRKG
jgi:hypothetical protein